MNLVADIPDSDPNKPTKCLKCKTKAVYWKLSLMGETRCGLCEEHKDWTMAVTFSDWGERDKVVAPHSKGKRL